MRFRRNIILVLSLSLLWLSCSNDLEVITDYQSHVVVYGLLDPSDTAQYIKVEKTFLGEGNAYVMAQQFDSINYKGGITVTMERIRNGSLQQVIVCHLDSVIKRDTGIFAGPKQYLYKTTEPILQDGSEYRLKVVNTVTGETVTAITPIVQQFTVQSPQASAALVNFADPQAGFTLKWVTGKEGKFYQPVIRFRYTESLKFDPTQVKYQYLDWKMLGLKSLNVDGGETMLLRMGNEEFYRFVAGSLSTDNTIERKVVGIDIIFTVAADEFNTYMEVGQANLSSLSDDIPYSNINGGIGLFSSRYTYKTHRYQLAPVAIDSLVEGHFTSHLNFVR